MLSWIFSDQEEGGDDVSGDAVFGIVLWDSSNNWWNWWRWAARSFFKLAAFTIWSHWLLLLLIWVSSLLRSRSTFILVFKLLVKIILFAWTQSSWSLWSLLEAVLLLPTALLLLPKLRKTHLWFDLFFYKL